MSNSEININQDGTGNTQNNTFNYNQLIQAAKQAGSLLNLPPTNVTFFAGRDEDLQKVHELLQQNQRVAVSAFVKGMGGIETKDRLFVGDTVDSLYGKIIAWREQNQNTL